MPYLSTIRRHYEMSLQSVVDLVERLEERIEELTLSNSSPSHFDHLQRTVSSQRNEIKRLNQALENKPRELLKNHQNNHQAQAKLQLRLPKTQQLNKKLQARILELEKALESDLSSARKQGRGLLTAVELAFNGKPIALTN